MSCFPCFQHLGTKDICLCLSAFFQTVFHRSRRLIFKGQFHAAGSEDIIYSIQERTDTSDSEIVYSLVDDFLQHDRSQSSVQGAGYFKAEFINPLAADQSGCDRHVTGDIVELLSLFIDNFIKSKMFK